MSKNRMKRKGKLRKTRKQHAGGTRIMSARIYSDPQATQRVNIHRDLSHESFQILLQSLADYLQGFSPIGNGFLLTYPDNTIDYSINEPDIVFEHVRVLPTGESRIIDFPRTLPHRLEHVILPIYFLNQTYYLSFSSA